MISNAIKKFRVRLCFTQVRLAQELEVSTGTVCAWEAGRRNPGLSNVLRMSEIAKQHHIRFKKTDFLQEG